MTSPMAGNPGAGRAHEDPGDHTPEAGEHGGVTGDAVDRALAAFARALRLSCLAARDPARAALANEAVAAHVVARWWAEEAVRRAGHARP